MQERQLNGERETMNTGCGRVIDVPLLVQIESNFSSRCLFAKNAERFQSILFERTEIIIYVHIFSNEVFPNFWIEFT